MGALFLNEVIALLVDDVKKFKHQPARKKIYGIANDKLPVGAENVAEHNGKDDHCKQGLKKAPKNTEPGIPVFQLNVFTCKLAKQVPVFAEHFKEMPQAFIFNFIHIISPKITKKLVLKSQSL